jgi:sulfite oxidase
MALDETERFTAEPAPGLGLFLGPLTTTSGILVPDDGARLPARPTDVIGYAFAGAGRRIIRVEVSLDGGRTWTKVDVDDPPSPWAWQLWHTTLDLSVGPVEITARAWDEAVSPGPGTRAGLRHPADDADDAWSRIRVRAGQA